MNCKKCDEKVEQDDKFCKNCGQDQLAVTINEESEYSVDILDDNEDEDESISNDNTRTVSFEKKSSFKKIFKGIGMGGLVVGGGFLYISFTILRFLFIALVGLSSIWYAITLFYEGSIIWSIIVLFIATPIVIALSGYFFIFLFFFSILSLIIWGIIHLFGFNVSFDSVWDGIWLVIKVFILGVMAFVGISSFIEAIKNKNIISFFKENWFYILIFFFLFWLFF